MPPRAGEVTGYLGPNGSDKSTTMKMVTGLVEPSDGEILFDGRSIRDNAIDFKRRIASYSKGMRQKILLSAALLRNPDQILLDELFSGLDIRLRLS